jgi:RsmE family RNA methyltransferase
MNLLLFTQSELRGTRLCLDRNDRRARHIVDILGLQPGDRLRVGMVNGDMGSARVLNIRQGSVEIETHLTEPPLETPAIELVLALPRPIMLKRILKQATVLGVRRFHLIRASRVQKSYFQTRLLDPAEIQKILVQALEQAVDTRLPEVSVHHRFMPFVQDVLPTLQCSCRLLAHPDEPTALPDLFAGGRDVGSAVLAVGPEGGWSDHEVRQFRQQGFDCFSMGARILHVDTAVVVFLAQLQLFQSLRKR